jgi:predicted enzyme related to lactoylglutathione lyase
MTTRLVHLVWDANDPAALARFWASALGWVIGDEAEDEVDVWPEGYSYPDPAAVPLVFVPVPEPKTGKNRVHLDLASTSLAHQAQQVERLRGLGASPVDLGQGAVPWVVLADPEGNEFCVLEPRDEYAGTGLVAAIVTDCADPAAMGRFWAEAAGYPVAYADEHITALRAPSGVGPYLEFLRVPDAKTVKNRLHPDVSPYLGEDSAAEVARLRGLGAVPADIGQGDVNWTVLADPEGNEFCVLSPR